MPRNPFLDQVPVQEFPLVSYYLQDKLGTAGGGGTSDSASYADTASYTPNAVVTASAVRGGDIINFVKGDGSSFEVAVTASNAVVTASAVNNVITFTKGDDSTFDVTVATGSGGGGGSAFPYTGSALITGSLGITGSLSVSQSLDTSTRQLYNSSNIATADWENNALYDSSNIQSISWGERTLYDTEGISSADWGARRLADANTSESINWDTRLLKDTTGTTNLDWSVPGEVTTQRLFVSGAIAGTNGLTITGSIITNNSFTGPILRGGTLPSGSLTLSSTSDAIKGKILFGTSTYDELNNRLGIGTINPTSRVAISNGSTSQIALNVTSNADNINTARIEGFFSDPSGVNPTIQVAAYLRPTASAAGSTRALYMTTQFSASSAASFTGNPCGGFFETRYLQSGQISRATGGVFTGIFIPASGVTSSIFITSSEGIQVQGATVNTGSGFTGTFTNVRGIYIAQPNKGASSATFTNSVGIVSEALTNATNNTYILLGTTTQPAGSWGIYVSSTNNNYFAGNVGLNVTPSSYRLDVNGTGRFSSALTTTGRIQAYSRKTSAYTLINTDRVIAGDATTAPFTITLPAHVTGTEYTIYKYDSTGNKVTISPTSGTISGNSTYDLIAQYNSITVVSDGTNWIIVSLVG